MFGGGLPGWLWIARCKNKKGFLPDVLPMCIVHEAFFRLIVRGSNRTSTERRSSPLDFAHLLSNFYYVYLVPVQFYADLMFRLTQSLKVVIGKNLTGKVIFVKPMTQFESTCTFCLLNFCLG